jgi:hypothetical protein
LYPASKRRVKIVLCTSKHCKLKIITPADFIVVVPHFTLPRNFFGGGVQQIQLRTEGREYGNLGASAP